ncbi:hypothetical protein ABPG74_007929 [Tetrahymena malaccensis]
MTSSTFQSKPEGQIELTGQQVQLINQILIKETDPTDFAKLSKVQLKGQKTPKILIKQKIAKWSPLNDQQIIQKIHLKANTLNTTQKLLVHSYTFICLDKMNQKEDSTLCAQQNSYNNFKNCTYTWLDKISRIQNLTFYDQSLRTYFFSTVTMVTVGNGDITPVNSKEYLLSILTMVVALGIYGYSLNGHQQQRV